MDKLGILCLTVALIDLSNFRHLIFYEHSVIGLHLRFVLSMVYLLLTFAAAIGEDVELGSKAV